MLDTVKPYYHKDDVVDFITSDGKVFPTSSRANRHEMFLRTVSKFPELAVVPKRTMGSKDYILDRHHVLRRGIYKVDVEDLNDMEALDHFFKGLYDTLGRPEAFPVSFFIDIYYERVPEAIIQHAQWRIYNEDDYRQ